MRSFQILCATLLPVAAVLSADQVVFKDDFRGSLGDSWSWIREHRPSWHVTDQGLEVRVEPGNMWGPANNASNVLVHPLPSLVGGSLEISVTVSNAPTEQYEQVDLVWYYDDSHMVKIGLEMVDGKLCIVMGREEADRTRTIAIIPDASHEVGLRLSVVGELIRGFHRPTDLTGWKLAGECSLPARGTAKASLQFYQGSPIVAHWALAREFRVVRHPAGAE